MLRAYTRLWGNGTKGENLQKQSQRDGGGALRLIIWKSCVIPVGQGNRLLEVEPRFNPRTSRDIFPHNDLLAAGDLLFVK